jgi:hypothetical protein
MRTEMLQNIYEMICESKMIYVIEMWGIKRGRIIDNIQGRFCKKVLRLPPSTINAAAEYELGDGEVV